MISKPEDLRAGPFIERVVIRNYKSIGRCSVDLGRLTVLIGRNGSGKSNFIDALHFVSDGLSTTLDHAIKARGGIQEVRRRSTGHPRNFSVELLVNLARGSRAVYGFEIGARQQGRFYVKDEHLRVVNVGQKTTAEYRLADGVLHKSHEDAMPPASSDRLYLVNAAGLPQYRELYDALSSMGFYNLNPETMKELQGPDAGELLRRDGSNIASVIARLGANKKLRIREYLTTVVPDITSVDRVALGPRETIEFKQRVKGAEHPWRFYAASMSDGTLRVLGALVAVTQLAERDNPVKLVGIEEPETALHPAAAGALMDSLREAAATTQVLVTSHSPDLLDHLDAETDTLLAVQSREGQTEIGPVDEASRQAIDEHLYSAGELLRMDQLQVDEADLTRQKQEVMDLTASEESIPL
jgi:predicted ATPase